MIRNRVKSKFLFILSPPYGGSTLLNQIVSSSQAVSVNNPFGTREGQRLPVVIDLMFNHKRRWDENLDFDWKKIKKEWLKYWDLTCPILLDKSPPNIIRAASINKTFIPSYFIVFYRNPYALSESYMRRENLTAKEAAEFVMIGFNYQKRNLEILPNCLTVSYEDLTNNPLEFMSKLSEFLPEIRDLNIERKFSAHNYKKQKMSIKNLNKEKISNLCSDDIQQMNSVFNKNKDLISYFGYDIIQ